MAKEMIDLALYAAHFDKFYPDYATKRYDHIQTLTGRLNEDRVTAELDSKFERFAELMEPVISIKNYKSQVPFPRDIKTVLQCAMELKQQRSIPPDPLSEKPMGIFLKIIEVEGFQLPTVSALFHFCHPKHYPIVDRYVAAACKNLQSLCRMNAPTIPSPSVSKEDKLRSYGEFIKFIDHVWKWQRRREPTDYRFIDKALMVLGNEKFRKQVEAMAARAKGPSS